MTDLPEGLVGENQILSNRDKSQHTEARGLDGKAIQVDQEQDTPANRQTDEDDAESDGGNKGG